MNYVDLRTFGVPGIIETTGIAIDFTNVKNLELNIKTLTMTFKIKFENEEKLREFVGSVTGVLC